MIYLFCCEPFLMIVRDVLEAHDVYNKYLAENGVYI